MACCLPPCDGLPLIVKRGCEMYVWWNGTQFLWYFIVTLACNNEIRIGKNKKFSKGHILFDLLAMVVYIMIMLCNILLILCVIIMQV